MLLRMLNALTFREKVSLKKIRIRTSIMVKAETHDTENIQTKPTANLTDKPQTQLLEKHNKIANTW